jgi:hypothetical protein
MIVDDNSTYPTQPRILYKTTIIQSEYPGRGELLPYYYYLHHKLFDTAVIIHDSVFFNSYIDIQVKKYKIIWNFEHYWDQIEDETRMILAFQDQGLLHFYQDKSKWTGCMGGMSIITHDYLKEINQLYNISTLLPYVRNRYNRCSFERVIACLLQKNEPPEVMFGDINTYEKERYGIQNIDKYLHLPLIKVFTGR